MVTERAFDANKIAGTLGTKIGRVLKLFAHPADCASWRQLWAQVNC